MASFVSMSTAPASSNFPTVRTARRLAILTVVLAASAVVLARKTGERGTVKPGLPTAAAIRVLPPDSVISGPVLADSSVGDYHIRLVHDTVANDKIVDILQNGHRVFAVRAADARLELTGKDITGSHVPEVVVQTFSGGMHCCSQATVLGLGPSLTQLGTIDGADGDIVFEDLDGDGVPEVKIGDFRFAYWRDYSFAETPVPDVILAWRQGAYRPACDLMRENAPSPATLTRKSHELTRGWANGDPPPGFWGYALDLIYQGHADLGLRFLGRSWPDSIPGKDDFVKDFTEHLRGSPCWSPPEEGPPIS